MLAGGYLMVACQLLTTAALWSSTTFPSCETSNQCERGRWCSVGVQASGGRCQPCGDDLPLPKQTDSARGYTYNKPAPSEADFAGYNLTLVMQTCAEPTQATVGIFGVGEVTLFSPEAVTSWCAYGVLIHWSPTLNSSFCLCVRLSSPSFLLRFCHSEQ